MTTPRPTRDARVVVAARIAWLLAAAASVATIAIRVTRNDPIALTTFGMGPTAIVAFVVFGMSWATFGAILVAKRPDNAVGRYVLVIGSAYAYSILSATIAFAGLAEGTAVGRTVAGFAGWLAGLCTLIGGAAFNVSILFPTGRGHTVRWDRLARFMFVPIVVAGAYLLTRPGDLHLFPGLANPFGIGPDLRMVLGDRILGITAIGSSVFVPVIVAAFISRYRAAGHIERLQLRWFAAATLLSLLGLVGVAIAGALFPGRTGELPLVTFALTGTTVPIAIAIAILRHHLYDIDRLVNRTISYVFVSVIVGGVFLGGVLGGQSVLAGILGDDSTVVVAASTLIAFTLSRPIRDRVQTAVDRRFDRTRFDGQQTVAAFAERVRDEVDLDHLGAVLLDSATQAVRPASATMWLPARSRT